MAMIKCPECGKGISDTAASCPNCGYVLGPLQKHEIHRTDLDAPTRNVALGIGQIVLGAALFGFGILLLGVLIGIFGIIAGVGLMAWGFMNISYTQAGPCPYCGHPVQVGVNQITVKCYHCKKLCAHTGQQLETMD